MIASGTRTKNRLAPNKVTGANAGGRLLSAIRALWSARIAQFWRYDNLSS